MNKNPARRAALLLKKVVAYKSSAADKALAPFGLSMASWVLLTIVDKNPGLSTHAIAVNCFVTDQSCGQLIGKLAGQGLLERKSGPGKAIRHTLTKEGKSLLEASEGTINCAMDTVFFALTQEEIILLGDLLQRLLSSEKNPENGQT